MRFALVRTPAGNFGRLRRALEIAGARVAVCPPRGLARSDGPIVLAGVSSFTTLTGALSPAARTLREAVERGRPVLGICAGLQGMYASSEEGPGRGLALLPGRVQRLRSDRVPNLGWSVVEPARSSRLLAGIDGASYAYFAHSYRVPRSGTSDVGWTRYRGERFPSAVETGSLWGVQFHPELSGGVGRTVLGNFVGFAREAWG